MIGYRSPELGWHTNPEKIVSTKKLVIFTVDGGVLPIYSTYIALGSYDEAITSSQISDLC